MGYTILIPECLTIYGKFVNFEVQEINLGPIYDLPKYQPILTGE
jgi:hypothetical protein